MLGGRAQSVGAHHCDVHPRDGQNAGAAPRRGTNRANWIFATELDDGMIRQEIHQVLRHTDGAHSRAAAAVWDAKGFVQVDVANVRAEFARLREADHGIEVGAIEIHLATRTVYDVANLPDSFLKHTVRGGVGDHDRGEIRGVRFGLGAQVVEVDVPFVAAFYGDHFEAGHHRAGGVGAVRAHGDEADVALRFSAALVIRLDDQQPRILALRTGIGLQRYAGESSDFRQPILEVGKHFLIPARLRHGHEGVDAIKFAPRNRLHFGRRIELHRARAPHQFRLGPMFVKNLVREKIASARQPFRRGRRGREFGQLEGHIAAAIKDRQQIEHVRFGRRFVQRDTEGLRIEHAQAIREVLGRWGNLIRSSLIGVFTGILPAAGGSISNILAYDQAKKASKHPEEFGTGSPEGIVAPEAANNATAGGALITMMALGIPGDIVTAIMLGALLIHDVIPSPTFITDEPRLAYGIFMAFFFANFIMVAMQAICLRGFVLVTRLRMYVLAGVILAYCGIGIFALNNIVFDMWTLLIFGVIGLVMKVMGFPLAPMILGVVLGHIAELNLNRALSTSDDLTLFLTRPWSLFFLLLGLFSILFPWYQKMRGVARWTLIYPTAMLICLGVPMFMMQGVVRPGLAVVMFVFGALLFCRHWRNGWRIGTFPDGSVDLENS